MTTDQLAKNATLILENLAFKAAFSEVRDYHTRAIETAGDDAKTVSHAASQLQALKQVRATLERYLVKGKLKPSLKERVGL